IEIQGGGAVLGNDLGQGAHVMRHILAEGADLINNESAAGQEQGRAAGQHDDPGLLALDGGFSEADHRSPFWSGSGLTTSAMLRSLELTRSPARSVAARLI